MEAKKTFKYAVRMHENITRLSSWWVEDLFYLQQIFSEHCLLRRPLHGLLRHHFLPKFKS
jgi:hypothetical protein